MKLKDKVAIITGAADIEGIGAAIAIGYAKEGAKIVIADITDGKHVIDAVKKENAEAAFFKTDVSKQEECNVMARATAELFGTIDILVNNAAIYKNLVIKPFTDITTEEWNQVMEVNSAGPFHCAKAVFPYMKDRGGKIINTSSDTVLTGSLGLSHYAASKGAVVAFTRSIALYLGEFDINVNSLAPGFTQSGASKTIESKSGEIIDERIVPKRCLKRSQIPEDVVGAAVFLASSDSDFVTGQLIAVNGGMTFH